MVRKKTIRKRKRSAIRRTGKTARRYAFAKGRAKMPYRLKRFSRMMNQLAEKKYFDQDAITYNVSTSGLIIKPLFPVQGTGRTNRIGSTIFARYWKCQGFIDQNQSDSILIRMALVWPKRVDYAIGDLPTTDYNQFFDPELFTVIWDKLIPLNPPYTGTTVANNTGTLTTRPFNFNVKIFRNLEFNTSGPTSQPAEIYPFLFLYTNTNSAFTNPTINLTHRLTYTDV